MSPVWGGQEGRAGRGGSRARRPAPGPGGTRDL
jgi:hypothetical protein